MLDKRDPDIAAARADLCAVYRRIRATDHGIARLLHRRVESATKLLKKHVRENWDNYLYGQRSADQSGGLSRLFSED
jgi:hypothetical protein